MPDGPTRLFSIGPTSGTPFAGATMGQEIEAFIALALGQYTAALAPAAAERFNGFTWTDTATSGFLIVKRWDSAASGGAGAWREIYRVNLTSGAATFLGLVIGTDIQAYSALLAAIAALGGNGLIARTAAGTAAARTLTAGAGISVTNGDGASGNPTIATARVAFQAHRTATQAIADQTWTKVQLNGESFDTLPAFDSSTNYRFQPNVAGYYAFDAQVVISTMGVGKLVQAGLYKNGSAAAMSSPSAQSVAADSGTTIAAVLHLNGSSDYVELYAWQNNGAQNIAAGAHLTFLCGALLP